MGELVVGRPAPKQLFAISAPLELTSAISLTFRAANAAEGRNPGFDTELVDAWQALDPDLRHDLDLLLGFSGRLIYYIEEMLFAFDALAPERLNASFDDYISFLRDVPPERFQQMAAHSLVRIYHDRGLSESAPDCDDAYDWRMFLRPGITRANIDEAVSLITSPMQLKLRTVALLEEFWHQHQEQQFLRNLPELRRAVRTAQTLVHPTVQVSFAELTGHRLPDDIAANLLDVDRVVYSPSAHLGSFIQYILYPPALILFFNPQTVLQHRSVPARLTIDEDSALSTKDLLDGLRALSDPSRIRIIEMLREGELYAQEIVARLNISQSAVSRHLSTLESAEIITVRPSNGMKYYAIDQQRMRAIAGQLDLLADPVSH